MNQRFIGPAFVVAILSSIGFCVVYGFGGNAQLEGLLLFGAFGGIGVGMILWAKHLFPQEELAQERPKVESSGEEQLALVQLIEDESGPVTRRKFLSRLGLGAIGSLGLAALFPLKSLGPSPAGALFHTEWGPGIRLVTEENRPIRPEDLAVGAVLSVWPEGKERKESSATLLVKVPANENKPRPKRETWAPMGNIAYSKICTHVGCPVGLYRKETLQLLCPCHQSTFDVLDGARATFGPASRSLPQLPLMVNPEGFLAAQSDYQEPVGPGFWNRESGVKL